MNALEGCIYKLFISAHDYIQYQVINYDIT